MTPDGAFISTSYDGYLTPTLNGGRVTVTDQAGKQRSSVSDALGRLVKVIEAPGVTGYGYETAYEYDPLGNLRKVTQGKEDQTRQTRTFVYDSLSRLTSAANPESGAVAYEYDPLGNLKRKRDARHVQTDYVYDALSRVTKRSYSVEPGQPSPAGYIATPEVNYFYDGTGMPSGGAAPSDSLGRLTAVKTTVSETVYTEFDAAGRVKKHRQVADPGAASEQAYLMEYGYDLAGSLTTEKYPSGRVVETEYDVAGRVAGVRNQSTGLYYAGAGAADAANRIGYAAHGAAEVTKLGNGLWEHATFNARLQPSEIGLGASAADSSVLLLTYGYGVTDNNGNVRSQRIRVGGGLDLTQTYEYDEVNRLLSAREASTAGGADTWRQSYTYSDSAGRNAQFGNRRVDASTDPATGQPRTTANAAPLYNPQINALNNRFEDGQGYVYDGAGNLSQDPSHSYGYDAEGRVAAVDGGWNGAGGVSYQYDGDGRRVRKVSALEATVFVYDEAGKLVAEYSNQIQYSGTHYLTQDSLGSTRVVTDAQGNAHSNSGASGSRHDYFPFGEEILADGSWRTGASGYGAVDNARQKFASYERDKETGLDYLESRYYSSPTGRFTSPDEPLIDQWEHDPQSWNLYSYVRNNPLRLVDPTGYAAQEQGQHTCQEDKDGRCGPFHEKNYTDENGDPVEVTNVRDTTSGPTRAAAAAVAGTVVAVTRLGPIQVVPEFVAVTPVCAGAACAVGSGWVMWKAVTAPVPPTVPNAATNTALVPSGPVVVGNNALSPNIYSQSKDNKKKADGLITAAERELEKLRNDPTGFASPAEHHKTEINAILDRARRVAERLTGKSKAERIEKIEEIKNEADKH
jgi:RHS repeat-associated protein